MVDYWATVYRRTWKGSVISSFVTPLLYILAMGVLLGGFIEGDPDRARGGHLLPRVRRARHAGRAGDDDGLRRGHLPRDGDDQVAADLLRHDRLPARASPTSCSRTSASCCSGSARSAPCSSLVMAPFGVFESWWGVLAAFLVQLLIGLAFAAPIYAITVGDEERERLRAGLPARHDPDVPVLRRVLPDRQPEPGDGVARPADAAVARRRPDPDARAGPGRLAGWRSVHVAYLAVLAVVGYLLAVRRLSKRLVD